jgi:adenosylhomocysteine nucleosidase
VGVIISGVGKKGAAAATDLLIDSFFPDLIISTGFAGALTPNLRVGCIVVARRIMLESGGERVSPVPRETMDISSHRCVREGEVVTVPRFISSCREKKQLFMTTGAHAVDMESYFVFEKALQKTIPCLAVRVISDDARRDLPPLVKVLDGTGTLAPRRALSYLAGHPAMILPTIRVLMDFHRAEKSLNRFLEHNIFSLS